MKQLYTYSFISGLAGGLYLPIWILYLATNGFDIFYIGILGTIFELIRFITEVPLGAFADCYGRKTALYLGSLFMLVSLLLLSITSSIALTVIAMILMAVGNSFESGALEACLSDYLINNSMENNLDKRFVEISIVNVLGLIIGAITIMYTYSLNSKLLFQIASLLFFINFIVAVFFIKELNFEKSKYSIKENTLDMLKKIFDSVGYLKKSKILIYFSLSTFFYSWSLEGIERFYQVFLDEIGVSVANISLIYIISCIIAILLMFLSSKLFNKVKGIELNILIIIRCAMFLLILISTTSNSEIAYGSLAIFLALSYLSNPIIQSFLNKEISSDIRATFLSMYELIGSCGEIFAGISIGYISKLLGIYFGIRLDGVIIIPVIIFTLLCIIKANKNTVHYSSDSDEI